MTKNPAGISQFHLYNEGEVQFVDRRVCKPVVFAHVADLHLPPHPLPDAWPEEYRQPIEWWNARFGHPLKVLPKLLDDIQSRGVDFIFFGGDILDCYLRENAELLVNLCRERNLIPYFQAGNHDWEDADMRYGTRKLKHGEYEVRTDNLRRLIRDWNMPGPYYSFERGGIRFLSLDTTYVKLNNDYAGFFDGEQTEWFLEKLNYEGPIIIFHHIPFNLPTLEYRMRTIVGALCCLAEDDNGRRIRSAIENCPNILGTFAGHMHFRSEDPLGHTCQFMVSPASEGQWRYVKIADTPPPPSIRLKGSPPIVDLRKTEI